MGMTGLELVISMPLRQPFVPKKSLRKRRRNAEWKEEEWSQISDSRFRNDDSESLHLLITRRRIRSIEITSTFTGQCATCSDESLRADIRPGISSTRSPVKRFESTSVSLTYKNRLISQLTRYSASAAANQEEINGVYVTIGIFHLFNRIKTAGVKLNECVPEAFSFLSLFFFFFFFFW